MSKSFNKLIAILRNLPEEVICQLLLTVQSMETGTVTGTSTKPCGCPYCGSRHFIKFGHKCGRQRYSCKECGRTFMETANTIMHNSHFGADAWKIVISDTMEGISIDKTVVHLKKEGISISHPTVFNMRHKILLALQDIQKEKPNVVGDVSELDETYVLDSYKGSKVPESAGRGARKHGAKAMKSGISNEYICICTGVQRKGYAIAESVNRAKPDNSELRRVFEGRVEGGSLILCDGLKGYISLQDCLGCVIQNVNAVDVNDKKFYNLNTVNNFHSFIKGRIEYYCGVATKYLNRYNTLFMASYRNCSKMIEQITECLLGQNGKCYSKTIEDVKKCGLLLL